MKFEAVKVSDELRKEVSEKWEKVYDLYHKEGKHAEAGELALKAMERIIAKYCADAKLLKVSNCRLQDVEDFEQNLKAIIITKLPDYMPYVENEKTGELVPVLGSSYFTYYLKEAFSDYVRGGDGFGSGLLL